MYSRPRAFFPPLVSESYTFRVPEMTTFQLSTLANGTEIELCK
jgi:hypothetical protein